jgi:hypothetical protein
VLLLRTLGWKRRARVFFCVYVLLFHALFDESWSPILPAFHHIYQNVQQVSVKWKCPSACYKGIWGNGGIIPLFQTSSLGRVEWSASRSGCFTTRKDLQVPMKWGVVPVYTVLSHIWFHVTKIYRGHWASCVVGTKSRSVLASFRPRRVCFQRQNLWQAYPLGLEANW